MTDSNKLPKVGDFSLLPPPAGVCQTCAREHESELPHDAQSLYFQYRFYADHDRWPTWRDAMEHCDESTRTFWTEHLEQRNVDIDGSVNPKEDK